MNHNGCNGRSRFQAQKLPEKFYDVGDREGQTPRQSAIARFDSFRSQNFRKKSFERSPLAIGDVVNLPTSGVSKGGFYGRREIVYVNGRQDVVSTTDPHPFSFFHYFQHVIVVRVIGPPNRRRPERDRFKIRLVCLQNQLFCEGFSF